MKIPDIKQIKGKLGAGVFTKHPDISAFNMSQNITYFILIILKVVTAKPCRGQRGYAYDESYRGSPTVTALLI